MRMKLAGLLAIMLAALVLAGCSNSNDRVLQGWVEAELIFVSPDEQGRVETLKVREGDRVQKGDLLFTVDDDLQKADVVVRNTAVINAQQSFDRAKELLKSAAGTQKTYEDAEAALRQAKANLDWSQTRLGAPQCLQPQRCARLSRSITARARRCPRDGRSWHCCRRAISKSAFLRRRRSCPTIKFGRHVDVSCDGCEKGLTAKVSFIARSAEYTPPVIYSLEERAKLVFLIEARPEQPDKFRVGQPVTVTLPTRAAQMNAHDIVIDVHGLTKKFDGRAVVRNLSMQVKRGTIYGFLGPNGSGKTTTIRMLCGLLTPDEGTGTCLGYDIRTETDKIKRQVGYMTQRFSLYQDLSVRENLEFIGRVYGIDQPVAAARAAIERLGLTGREEQIAGELSGGWKQRLALGACTLPSPQLLLLDEPTAGVDPKARREFWNEIHALAADGLTVLVSTHYMDEAERCHEIAYIAYGELLAHGTVERSDRGFASDDLCRQRRSGEGLMRLADELNDKPGIDMVAPFGTSLHVSGRDEAALEAAIAPYRKRKEPRLAAIRAFARGCVHRSDGQGAGQFPMTHLLPSAGGAAASRRRLLAQDLGHAGEGIHPAQA